MCSKLLQHSETWQCAFARHRRHAATDYEEGYRRTLRVALRGRWRGSRPGTRRGRRRCADVSPSSNPSCRRPKTGARSSCPAMRPRAPASPTPSRYAEQVEEILAQVPELQSYLVIVGAGEVTRFNSYSRLKDWSEREVSQQDIVQKLLPKLRKIAGVQASASNPASLGVRGFGKPFQFVIQSSASYEEINRMAQALVDQLEDNPGLRRSRHRSAAQQAGSRSRDRPRARRRHGARHLGDRPDAGDPARRARRHDLRDRQRTIRRDGGAAGAISGPHPIRSSRIFVRNASGEMVQLSNVVKVRETVVPRDLRRFNQLRAITIEANLSPGYTLGEAIAAVDAGGTRGAAGRNGHRPHRPEPRVPRRQFQPCVRVRAGARLHLPRAVGPVRELPRSDHDHADRAAVDDRGAGCPLSHRRHAQRLFADRAGHAHRAHHQARHPDRRFHQPAAGRGQWRAARPSSRPRCCACGPS